MAIYVVLAVVVLAACLATLIWVLASSVADGLKSEKVLDTSVEAE